VVKDRVDRRVVYSLCNELHKVGHQSLDTRVSSHIVNGTLAQSFFRTDKRLGNLFIIQLQLLSKDMFDQGCCI
jgi:hypothetical protein